MYDSPTTYFSGINPLLLSGTSSLESAPRSNPMLAGEKEDFAQKMKTIIPENEVCGMKWDAMAISALLTTGAAYAGYRYTDNFWVGLGAGMVGGIIAGFINTARALPMAQKMSNAAIRAATS